MATPGRTEPRERFTKLALDGLLREAARSILDSTCVHSSDVRRTCTCDEDARALAAELEWRADKMSAHIVKALDTLAERLHDAGLPPHDGGSEA